MSLLFLLLTLISGMIPVEIQFRVGGVPPEQFDELTAVIASYLEIPLDDIEVSDYEEAFPTLEPTPLPTEGPTLLPTEGPTLLPTEGPTDSPTKSPTQEPTTQAPTPDDWLTGSPTETPTEAPSQTPTQTPTQEPTQTPTQTPTQGPTQTPTQTPTRTPSQESIARRRQSLDDLYTLVFVVYVDDQAAADALIASVQEKQDQQEELAKAIADELGMDPADIIASPTLIEYQENPSSDGNTNSVAGWVIAIAVLATVIAGFYIITYGKNYKPSDAFLFEESWDHSEAALM